MKNKLTGPYKQINLVLGKSGNTRSHIVATVNYRENSETELLLTEIMIAFANIKKTSDNMNWNITVI